MYEDEIRKQRISILKGLASSSKSMMNAKIEKNSFIAISNHDKSVKVVKAKELSR